MAVDQHDQRNIQRILKGIAAAQGVPVWVIRFTIRKAIAGAWERSRSDPEAAALWEQYFPGGRQPTVDEYILRLGRAHERGEEVPYLL